MNVSLRKAQSRLSWEKDCALNRCWGACRCRTVSQQGHKTTLAHAPGPDQAEKPSCSCVAGLTVKKLRWVAMV